MALSYLALALLAGCVAAGLFFVWPSLYAWTFFGLAYALVVLSPVAWAISVASGFSRVLVRVIVATACVLVVHAVFVAMGTSLLWPGILAAPPISLFLEWRRVRRLRTASDHV
ncbi:hypothetical protein PQS31_00310 [Luteimonas sp BLCC-B24]|uniref:hypothetical protein n=1 Tax=Luteimonas sp. BLCC-B24 TaxID=3025317 RepID=UPI00234E170C|nr:hypothetical protein [Luteimonas sp. BLCC-B24]MDC7805271.1 hypothetical protein [Luteimonas sp. BLCC-B24]